MKKLIILFLLVLVGCSNTNETVTCSIQYDESQKIERQIVLSHEENKIVKIETVDKIYFDEVFTKDDFSVLKEEIELKLADAKHLTYEILENGDHVEITSTLKNIEEAFANELTFIGIEINDKDLPLGLKETIKLNEEAGYVCPIVNEE